MNMIIDLILKIFEAIFEEDRDRRMKARQARMLERRPRGPGPNGPEGDAVQRQMEGEEGVIEGVPIHQDEESWLAEIFARERTAPSRPKPPPKKKWRKPKAASPPPIPQSSQKPVGSDGEQEHAASPGLSRLPGNTPVEQLIYAQVILGPCKAHRHHRKII